ncbi:MAG: hypothetical protein II888_06380 [Clostridia bacterium]|nr:hypothetical protein [Clostridia bacterium]
MIQFFPDKIRPGKGGKIRKPNRKNFFPENPLYKVPFWCKLYHPLPEDDFLCTLFARLRGDKTGGLAGGTGEQGYV